VSGGIALWSGFASFFSIWQVCILQISPFFIAYMVGLYLLTLGQRVNPDIRQWVILPSICYAIGFTIFYSLLIASGLNVSRILIYNIGNLRVAAGIIILLASLYILLNDRISFLSRKHSPLLLSVLSLFIGISFAIIYSPCITPTLSDIMGLASQRVTASEGWYLAFCYGLGISIALILSTVAIILLLRKRAFILNNISLMKIICGIIVLIPALLNIAGLMRHYKAMVLGLLV
jgi:cytochrome c-type biogenesis protein